MLMQNNIFKFKTLADVMQKKSDAFTFIRLFAALLVLYAHSYHIFGLGADPLSRRIGFYTGTLAVYIFFTISGFFILQSAIKRTFIEYTVARLARIFPGLIVANIITIAFIIPVAEKLSILDFISKSSSWEFIKTNSLLETVTFTLPDVFVNHPDQAINGSLWTLPVEVRAYISSLLIVALGITVTRARYNASFILLVLVNSLFPEFFKNIFPIPGSVGLIFFFSIGGLLYINRNHIPISPLLTIIGIGGVFYYRGNLNSLLLPVLVAYIIISIGYLLGFIKFFNLKHDYSYGLYLYAYPVSQMSFSLLSEYGFVIYFIFISCVTFAVAILSWHCVEKPIANFARVKIVPYLSSLAKRYNMINVRDNL